MISTITAIGGIISLIIMIFLLSRGLYFLKNNDHKSFNKNSDIITVVEHFILLFMFSTLGYSLLKETGLTNDLINLSIYIICIILIIILLIMNITTKIIKKSKASSLTELNKLLVSILFALLAIIFIFRIVSLL